MVDVIQISLIDKVWPHIWPLISDAVVLETEQELKDSLKKGEQFLLIVGDGFAIVRPGEVFWINYVGGENLKAWWPQLSEMIDSLAKQSGSKKIAAVARTAWKRFAPDYEATEQRLYMKDVA